MQNKANFRKVKLNVNKVLTKNYDQKDTWSIRKTKPIQSQSKPIKANSKPIKANIMPKQSQFKPNRTQCLPATTFGGLARPAVWRACPPSVWRIRANIMLPRMKINTRPNSLAHYTDKIQAPNACDRKKAGNRINSISDVDLLHFTGQTAKICIVIRFERLIFT
jgi:hypothetical protein